MERKTLTIQLYDEQLADLVQLLSKASYLPYGTWNPEKNMVDTFCQGDGKPMTVSLSFFIASRLANK